MAPQEDKRSKKRVVLAGLGDTGLLIAIDLARDYDVIAVSPKACFVSGQELGTRLAQPERWKKQYCLDYQRFRRLDGIEFRQGLASALDPDARELTLKNEEGQQSHLRYDALVICSGVTNGFWREPSIQSREDITLSLGLAHRAVAQSEVVSIIGAGPSGVSCAVNIATRWPEKKIALYFSGKEILVGYHDRVRKRIKEQLVACGVRLFPEHRAKLPERGELGQMTSGPVGWATGQPDTTSDLVLWTIGRVRPNNDFVPPSMLNEEGFVKVDEYLRVPHQHEIFAVGDIAASDPQRSSARNWGYRVVAHNIRKLFEGHQAGMKTYTPTSNRWGSVVGVQPNGLEVFQPNGRHFRFPRWSLDTLLYPILVNQMIYGGIRSAAPAQEDG